MNSDDPFFKNYMALWLCICKDYSISTSLRVMFPRKKRTKEELDDEQTED